MTTIDQPTRNRNLRNAKLFYFFLGGLGFISPYLNIFYTRLHLTGTEIGIIGAVSALARLIFAPFWATWSDNSRHPRRWLQASLILTTLAYILLGQQSVFTWILLLSALVAAVSSGITPLSDGLAHNVARSSGKGFGAIRIMMSLGWIVFVLSGSWVARNLGIRLNFWGVAATLFAGAIVIAPFGAAIFAHGHSNIRVKLKDVLVKLRRNRPLIALALMMIITGFANAGVLQFDYVYLEQLGAREELIGIAGIMGATIEIPFMLYADRLVRRRSPLSLLLLAMGLTSLARGIVLVFPSVPIFMIGRLIGGVGFSFYAVGLIRFMADNCAPQEMRTVMALYNVTLMSIITILGAPIAGAISDWVGIRPLFGIAAAGYFLAFWVLKIMLKDRPSQANDPST